MLWQPLSEKHIGGDSLIEPGEKFIESEINTSDLLREWITNMFSS